MVRVQCNTLLKHAETYCEKGCLGLSMMGCWVYTAHKDSSWRAWVPKPIPTSWSSHHSWRTSLNAATLKNTKRSAISLCQQCVVSVWLLAVSTVQQHCHFDTVEGITVPWTKTIISFYSCKEGALTVQSKDESFVRRTRFYKCMFFMIAGKENYKSNSVHIHLKPWQQGCLSFVPRRFHCDENVQR